jgi:hypothetical protein
MTRREEDIKDLESLFQRHSNVKNRNTIMVVIFIGITILIVLIVPFSNVQIKNESLLLVLLIFGIYLVLSGRISQLKFMDFEVQIKDVVGKTPRIVDASSVEIGKEEIRDDSLMDKESLPVLENKIKPKLIENAKAYTSPILRLVGTENTSDPRHKPKRYEPYVALEYLKYFRYVLFVDYDGKFYGFSAASDISNELNKDSNFIGKLNSWELDAPVIKKNAYVEEHTTRKQVLDKMHELGLDTLPIVSEGKRYVGVTQKDIIIMGIVKDLYARYVQS